MNTKNALSVLNSVDKLLDKAAAAENAGNAKNVRLYMNQALKIDEKNNATTVAAGTAATA